MSAVVEKNSIIREKKRLLKIDDNLWFSIKNYEVIKRKSIKAKDGEWTKQLQKKLDSDIKNKREVERDLKALPEWC